MHEVFKQFIEYKKCSFAEFNKVRNYIYKANQGQNEFLKTCFKIVKEVLENMYQNNSLNFQDYQEIYEYHGLTTSIFECYFTSYIENHMTPKELSKYTKRILIPLASKIGNEFKNANFDTKALKDIARSYNFTLEKTNNLINYYFKTVLQISNFSEYKRKYKFFKAYINLNMTNINDFKHAYYFYNNFASQSEKQAFAKTSLQIIKTSINTPSLKKYLNKINLSLKDFYFLISTYTPKLKNKLEEAFKEYFDFCENNLWNLELISKEAKKQNVSYEDYLYFAKIYGTNILHIRNIEEYIKQKRISTTIKEFPEADILTQIYQSTNEDEYYSLFAKINDLGIDIIYRFCYTYNRHLPMAEKEKMEANLTAKLNLYYKRKRENNTKSTTAYTSEVIEEALNSKHTIEQFCLIYGYDKKTLITKIRHSNSTNLSRLQEKLAQEKVLSNQIKENLTATILNYIKNGFPIGNQILPFTLLDFFILFPNIPYNYLRKNALTKEEAIILNIFFKPLKATSNLSKSTILNMRLTKQVTFEGQTYLKKFTQDELFEIVDYMEKYQIPFNELLFHQICIRYATTGLDIYNENELDLK